MMSKVMPLTRSIDRELIKKLFQKFSAVYGALWNSRCSTTEEWYECSSVWLDGLRGFEFDVLKKAVTQAFLTHKDYPPTLGQMLNICLHLSGVPSESQIINLMVRRDFNHPLVKVIYDAIGSWNLSHDKPEEMNRKVKAIYADCLSTYRENPDKAWSQLESFKALPEPAEPPSKIPTERELIGWRERFSRYKEMSLTEKADLKPVDHPFWDKHKVLVGHRDFDANVHKERIEYLTGLDEKLSMTLCKDDQYDRIRFLREELAARHVQSMQDVTYIPPKPKEALRTVYGAKNGYKHWMGD